MQGQTKVQINEIPPRKLTKLSDGYEVVNNDGTIKIVLRHVTVMDGSMESGFYSSILWVKEDNGWVKGDASKNYKTKEEFIKAISESEEFTQACREFDSIF